MTNHELLMKNSETYRGLYMRYLGALGFIAESAVHLDDEARETIERIFDDAVSNHPSLSWRRVLNRFELSPSFVVDETADKTIPEIISRARVVELAKNAGFPGFAAFIEKGFDVVPSGPDNADG